MGVTGKTMYVALKTKCEGYYTSRPIVPNRSSAMIPEQDGFRAQGTHGSKTSLGVGQRL